MPTNPPAGSEPVTAPIDMSQPQQPVQPTPPAQKSPPKSLSRRIARRILGPTLMLRRD